jgi:hypothetical protein
LGALDGGVGFLQQCLGVREVAITERVSRVFARFSRVLVVVRAGFRTVRMDVVGHGCGFSRSFRVNRISLYGFRRLANHLARVSAYTSIAGWGAHARPAVSNSETIVPGLGLFKYLKSGRWFAHA